MDRIKKGLVNDILEHGQKDMRFGYYFNDKFYCLKRAKNTGNVKAYFRQVVKAFKRSQRNQAKKGKVSIWAK